MPVEFSQNKTYENANLELKEFSIPDVRILKWERNKVDKNYLYNFFDVIYGKEYTKELSQVITDFLEINSFKEALKNDSELYDYEQTTAYDDNILSHGITVHFFKTWINLIKKRSNINEDFTYSISFDDIFVYNNETEEMDFADSYELYDGDYIFKDKGKIFIVHSEEELDKLGYSI